MTAALSDFTPGAAAAASAPVVQEFALVSAASSVARSRRSRTPASSSRRPLLNCYDRTATTVNANVGPATAGSSVTEVMGSGSAPTPNQSSPSRSRRSPTSRRRPRPAARARSRCAPTASPGPRYRALRPGASGSRCSPTLDLAGRRHRGRASATASKARRCRPGRTTSMAATGSGSGSAGNVARRARSPPSSTARSASAAYQPAARDRRSGRRLASTTSAPTRRDRCSRSGRAVSIADYQNLAASSPGIAKACAHSGSRRAPTAACFITVAGAGGAALPPGNPTLGNLVTALRSYGNPTVGGLRAVVPRDDLPALGRHLATTPPTTQTAVQAAIRSTPDRHLQLRHRAHSARASPATRSPR